MDEQEGRNKSTRNDSDTISFRLVTEYREKLQSSAKAAGITPHQMARQLLVCALENPSREDLLQDLNELAGVSEFLLEEVRAVHREIALLKGALAESLSLFLVTVGVSDGDVERFIGDLFQFEEDKES